MMFRASESEVTQAVHSARKHVQVLNMISDPGVEHAVKGAGAPLAAVDDLRRCLPPPYKELGLEKRAVRALPLLLSELVCGEAARACCERGKIDQTLSAARLASHAARKCNKLVQGEVRAGLSAAQQECKLSCALCRCRCWQRTRRKSRRQSGGAAQRRATSACCPRGTPRTAQRPLRTLRCWRPCKVVLAAVRNLPLVERGLRD